MNVEDSYVEVRASQNVFSKAYAEKVKLPLPQTWIVEPRTDSIIFSPYISLAVSMFGAFNIVIGKLTVGSIIFVLFGLETIFLYKRSAIQKRLEPGRITIRKEGFIDDRFGPEVIKWDFIDRFRTVTVPRVGTLLGVQLWSNVDANIPPTSPTYDKTYSLQRIKAGPDLFIDLKGVKNGFQIAEAVQILIQNTKSAGFNPPQ